ncbi:DUF805 domain-containing protein [uncultured Sulfitobacter sp.]|uniref:DUF805 domain-containing protein n=1 Tax=uncultured Sulfitobacter sp. TaxID=191468 RepID=UPI002620CF6E|nr:DUF805 domain-containing protein [uncultured Sulfitobacter sp.]
MTGPIDALTQSIVHMFNFSGRATRSEYWWPYITFSFVFGIALVADIVMVFEWIALNPDSLIPTFGMFDLYSVIVSAITFLPLMSLSIRRLHDVGMSGFVWLLNCIPMVGWLILMVIYAMPSVNRTSVHGSPKRAVPKTVGSTATLDTHQRAMQGYALLFDKERQVTPEQEAARKAEISDYYRSHVLKPASGV